MANELSVYNQLTVSPEKCLSAIRREIGMKTTCIPFAVKVIEALKSLTVSTEQQALEVANTFLGGMQTLWQGGILAEDYDKIDFVKRSGKIVPSARVEAFYRAAARKGYRIIDTIVAVPEADGDTTYFKENFYNGDIIYTLEDVRKEPDREVTAQRLADKYFRKFICRLDIHNTEQNSRVTMITCEISAEEMLQIASASEQGIYVSKWESYINDYGQSKNRKVITKELNTNTFWVKWTSEMVNKSIIRRALKRVREVLPELKETIYAFDREEDDIPVVIDDKIDIPIQQNIENVDLNNLTDEQQADCEDVFELFRANPKLAEDKFNQIMERFKSGEDKQSVINDEYAAIVPLMRSRTKSEHLWGYLQ